MAASGTALVTLAAVIVGASLSGRTQRNHWVRETRLKACSEFLRSYSRVFIDVGQFCRNGAGVSTDTWADWEQVLAGLTLVSSPQVVSAALKVDEAVWRAHTAVKTGRSGEDDWLSLRQPIEAARVAFVNAARRQLIPGDSPHLTEVQGRPADDDPMWIPVQEARKQRAQSGPH